MNKNFDLPKGLASPAKRALAAAGITLLKQLAHISREELLKLHGMGPKAIEIITRAMLDRGLHFTKDEGSIRFSEKANRRLSRCIPARTGEYK